MKRQRKLKCILLSERSQSEKTTYCLISMIWHSGKGNALVPEPYWPSRQQVWEKAHGLVFISVLISRCSCGKSLSRVGVTMFLQGLGLLEQRLIPMGVNDILKQKVHSNHRNTEYMEKARHTHPFPVTEKVQQAECRSRYEIKQKCKQYPLLTFFFFLQNLYFFLVQGLGEGPRVV